MTDRTGEQTRNLVICMDGTGNAPKASGNTNVLRLFGMLDHDDPDRQIAFYTPGVGTRGDPAALTGPAKALTKIRGLISGYGMRRDVTDAYTFLVENYRPGDRVFIFGFSRGAFAALALTGACRLFGRVRRSSVNMVPYVATGISRPLRRSHELGSYKFRARFSHRSEPPVPGRHSWVLPIHFIGLWDTVKALKYFKYVTRLKEGWLKNLYHPAWPFTGRPDCVGTIRHAVSIDDRRIPYDVFPIRPDDQVDFTEVWFAGVHSDVGGGFEHEPGLGRITLKWMVEAAVDKGLLVRDGEYEDKCTVVVEGDQVPRTDAEAKIHRNSVPWYLVGLRRRLRRRPFRRRFFRAPWKWFDTPEPEEILVHQSVFERSGYTLPRTSTTRAVDGDWTTPRPRGHPHQAPSSGATHH